MLQQKRNKLKTIMPVYSQYTKKIYNILEIQGNEKINDNLLDIMKDYNSISFTSKAFKQNLAGLPSHIKYIDISNTGKMLLDILQSNFKATSWLVGKY